MADRMSGHEGPPALHHHLPPHPASRTYVPLEVVGVAGRGGGAARGVGNTQQVQ